LSDGALIEAEDLQLDAHNKAFEHFQVSLDGHLTLQWSDRVFRELIQRAEQGITWMHAYFQRHGWPSTTILKGEVPSSAEDKMRVLQAIEEFKSAAYAEMLQEEGTEARPGVLRVISEAREAGLKLAVCSTALRTEVAAVLANALGSDSGPNGGLDAVTTRDSSAERVTHTTALRNTAAALGVEPKECVVVDVDKNGLECALKAGMRCIVTYTANTKAQAFPGAERIIAELGFPASVTVQELQQARIAQDDRVDFNITNRFR